MRVIINVKIKPGKIQFQSSSDKVSEINVGKALLKMIENTLQDMPNVKVTEVITP